MRFFSGVVVSSLLLVGSLALAGPLTSPAAIKLDSADAGNLVGLATEAGELIPGQMATTRIPTTYSLNGTPVEGFHIKSIYSTSGGSITLTCEKDQYMGGDQNPSCRVDFDPSKADPGNTVSNGFANGSVFGTVGNLNDARHLASIFASPSICALPMNGSANAECYSSIEKINVSQPDGTPMAVPRLEVLCSFDSSGMATSCEIGGMKN